MQVASGGRGLLAGVGVAQVREAHDAGAEKEQNDAGGQRGPEVLIVEEPHPILVCLLFALVLRPLRCAGLLVGSCRW